jgi:cell division protein DivIC
MLKRLPPAFRNFYIVTGLCFLVWMFFLDSNDLISRFKLGAKLRNLNNEKEFYQAKIEDVQKDREELMTNKELLEKFAREKYLMKKEKEDIFIIQEEED